MKRPLFAKKEDLALPSSYEKHTGEVRDPTGHEPEIEEAMQVLHSFVADMDAKKAPIATLDSLSAAADSLCTYAGCPHSAVTFVDYLTSPYAGKSYQHTAALVKDYLAEMSEVIDARLTIAARSGTSTRFNRNLNDDDLPI